MKLSIGYYCTFLLIISPYCFSAENPYASVEYSSKTYFGNLSHEEIDKLCINPESGGTELIEGCMKLKWEHIDKKLKLLYRNAVNKKIKDDHINNTKIAYTMKAEQNDWEKYRQHHCDVVYFSLGGDKPSQGGGTGVPAEYMSCMIGMAKNRIKELQYYQ